MTFTTDLLDAAKAAANISSDYRLAQVLGVKRATVSAWRNGRSFPLHSSTCELARMAGIEPGDALFGVGVDRLGTPENRPKARAIGDAIMADQLAYEAAHR